MNSVSQTLTRTTARHTSSASARWRILIFPGATEVAMELRQALGACKEAMLFSGGEMVSNHAPFVFSHYFEVPSVWNDAWLNALERVILDHQITHVFPAHDDALLALAENAQRLSAKVVTSPLTTCRIARSKRATAETFSKVIPMPRLFDAVDEVREFPVFLKPDRGQGAQRTAVAHDRASLKALLLQDDNRIIQELLPGSEFTVDCFSDRRQGLLYAAGRRRIRIRSGIAMDSVFINDPHFEEFARRINEQVPLYGAWFFQLREDKNGELRLMEFAPRIGGTSALSRARGVNLPLLSLYEAEGIPVQVHPLDFSVELDRALVNRFRHNLKYKVLYVDFDDTLVIHDRLNVDLIKLLYQAFSRGVRLILLTRHAEDIHVTLQRWRLSGLFDEVVHIKSGEQKADSIATSEAIFIDDSYAERLAVQKSTGIPTFDPTMIEVLMDDRV